MNYRGYRLATRQTQQVTVITIYPPNGKDPLPEFIVASRFEPAGEVLERARALVDEHLAKQPTEAVLL